MEIRKVVLMAGSMEMEVADMKVLKMENYVVAVSECRMVGGTEQ